MSQIKVDTITDAAGTGAPSLPYGITGAGISGEVRMFARTSAPTGWLACNGAAVSRTTYAALFAAIGTTYGVGDGSTTFNVPDCRGVFVRGAGSQTISGITYTGSQGTTQGDATQGHKHSTSDPGHSHATPHWYGSGGQTTKIPTADGLSIQVSTTTTSSATGITIENPSNDGSNGTPRTGAETRPANVCLLYCIST